MSSRPIRRSRCTFRVEEDYSNPVYEERIIGQWYDTSDGYVVELRIPMEMLGDRLGFAVFDVDDPESHGEHCCCNLPGG